jgi:uncharacterized protein YqhQ
MKALSGKSSFAGFMIKVKHKGVIKDFFTNNFSQEEYDKNPAIKNMPSSSRILKVLIIMFVSLWTIGNVLHFFLEGGMGILSCLFLALTCLIASHSLTSLGIVAYYDRESRKWHACEHKIAHILKKNKPIDIDAFKRASRFHRNCGTSLMVNVSTLCLFVIFYPLIRLTPFGSSIILAFSAYYLSYVIFSYLIQVFITTGEPDESQYNESIRLAGEIQGWALTIDKFLEPDSIET